MFFIETNFLEKLEMVVLIELEKRSFLYKINLVHISKTKLIIKDSQIVIETRIHEELQVEVYCSTEPNPPATQGNKSQVVGTIYPLLALAKEVS